MAKMMSVRIDVNKINKEKLFKGEKGTYLDLTVALNDTPDQYGNDCSAWESQSKEEREAKSNKNFLGNGKVFWSNEGGQQQAPQANRFEQNSQAPQAPAGFPTDEILPF